jgi:acetylornithine deacetylase/succinyl-diaminopimelate desuccinylase-like protein
MRAGGHAFIFAAALASAALAAVGSSIPAQPVDPDIRDIVQAVSAERIQRSIYVLTSFKTRHTLSDTLPSGDGIGGAASWVRAEFGRASAESGNRLQVELDTFDQAPVQPRVPQGAQITNIVATLPGTDPSGRTVVISGHYDSRVTNILDSTSPAPGADDDASGTAAVLELAHVMSHYKFGATIVFLVVAGEEQGLLGSAHWARAARQRSADIEADLNNDIIGNTRAEGGEVDRSTVRLFAQGLPAKAAMDDGLVGLIREGGENDTPARELARAIKDIAAVYVPSMSVRIVYRVDRYLRGSDHQSFLDQGYAAVRFTEPSEDYRHEHQDVREVNGVMFGDLPEKVDFAYVADVARVNASALAVLARAPAPPKKVQIETARLENDTTLRWEPDTGPGVAGYRIVWRETTSPSWQQYMDVGSDVTRVTVKGASKDDFIFGVEAFDAAGHVSPAVFPAARMTL